MKKPAKVLFIILLIITILLLLFSLVMLFFKNEIIYILNKTEYVPTGIGERKSSYVVTIPDVELLDKYQTKNENMLVIFMASWCHFCQNEAPELNNFINDNPNKKIIIVSHDETKDDIESFLLENGYNWFVIFDPDRLIRSSIDPDGKGIPAAYLLDCDGNILNQKMGQLKYDDFLDLYNISNMN